MTRRALTVLLALALSLAAFSGPALAVPPSLPDVEDEVMCPTCSMPLNTAQSPQADDQREFIRDLIAQGKSKDEIKTALVAEYGDDVLAEPDEEGFGLAAYLLPIVCVLLLVMGLAVLLPRWRGSKRDDDPEDDDEPLISDADAARLRADLARYDP